jgi:hypothetical protein
MVNVLHVDQIDDDVSARPIADEEGDGVPGQPIRSNARPDARRTERDAIAWRFGLTRFTSDSF